jgi:hypothetical protein
LLTGSVWQRWQRFATLAALACWQRLLAGSACFAGRSCLLAVLGTDWQRYWQRCWQRCLALAALAALACWQRLLAGSACLLAPAGMQGALCSDGGLQLSWERCGR